MRAELPRSIGASLRTPTAEGLECIAVLIDKKGTDEIAGVPVVSLLKVIRVN